MDKPADWDYPITSLQNEDSFRNKRKERQTDPIFPEQERALARHLPFSGEEFTSWENLCWEAKETRIKKIDDLSTSKNRSILPTLARALNEDPAWEVRAAAVQAWGAFGNEVSAKLLNDALSYETDDTVRQVLIRTLGQRRDRQLAKTFENIVLNEEEDCLVREAAAWALGLLEEHAPLQALIKALYHDTNVFVRTTAAHSLGKSRNNAAERALFDARKDAEESVREAATWARAQLGSMKQEMLQRKIYPVISLSALQKIKMRITQHFDYNVPDDQEQWLRETAFLSLRDFIRGKRGFIDDVRLMRWRHRPVLILNYIYEQNGKLLSDEILPTIEQANAISIGEIDSALATRKKLLWETIQWARKRNKHQVWYELSIVSISLRPPRQAAFEVILCGTACQQVPDSDRPILKQILHEWRRYLEMPLVCDRMEDLKHLQIWYQSSNCSI